MRLFAQLCFIAVARNCYNQKVNSDMVSQQNTSSSWLDAPLTFLTRWDVEKLLVTLILFAAVFSRFYNVGLRVMSHDEVNHVVPSYSLYQGEGYRVDPVTHGPLQFHLIALSFFMLGDSDFSARVPAALFSVAAVAFVLFGFRRYLGRTGALIAGFLFLISPYLLFYGRYTRNEGIIELLMVVMIYGVLRYLDRGDFVALILLTIATVLHFTSKETAYIYVGQMLLFIGALFAWNVSRLHWNDPPQRTRFAFVIGGAIVFFLSALGLAVWKASLNPTPPGAGETAATPAAISGFFQVGEIVLFLLAVVFAIYGIYILLHNLGFKPIRSQRTFDLLVLLGTLVLPLLTAFPVKMLGWDPMDYSTTGIIRTGIVAAVLFALSLGIGLWWNPRKWLINAAIFWGLFIVFYTTFFTNGVGFFSGLVGALGYWLSQQQVERGSQPLYYYALIQIPIYEYLSALGTILAFYFGIRFNRFSTVPGISPAAPQPLPEGGEVAGEGSAVEVFDADASAQPVVVEEPAETTLTQLRVPTLALLLFWSLTSLIAYSVAGERMPWLTVHIALPMALAAGWGLGFLVDQTEWKKLSGQKGLVVALLLLPVFITSLVAFLGVLLGGNPPFQGSATSQLEVTSTFLLSGLVVAASLAGILWLFRNIRFGQTFGLFGLTIFAFLSILTMRTAYTASFVNYDNAKEFLVYAHAAAGPKEVLAQVAEISQRTTGGKNVVVAYDNDALYPYWWYLRAYPNKVWYTDKPTRDLANDPLIIAGDSTSGKLAPILKDNYIDFEYMRLWWPNQDYFNLTGTRIWDAVRDPQMRQALLNIWLSRDYTLYAKITNNPNLTLETWEPSSRMHFYVRKDIAAQIWNYGVTPAASVVQQTDPYVKGLTQIQPQFVIGQSGDTTQMQAPRDVATAPDGSAYVADSRNHRILHFSASGELLQGWGTFADASAGQAPGGTFNEPWGVAVGPDGSVYVADTWNHRIQKFSATGEFITMWGAFGQGESPTSFWGPRGVAVDSKGHVFVSDTGNKRIVVFDGNGNYITQIGGAGFDIGQFDEPVGVAVDKAGNLYVADTWNQRVQVFAPNADDTQFTPLKSWEVSAWAGQSLDNKPYLDVAPNGNVIITDPDSYRMLMFDSDGKFISGWDSYAGDGGNLAMYAGVAVDANGNVWATDASNNKVLKFALP